MDGSAIGGSKRFSAHLSAPRMYKLLSDKAVRFELKDYEPEPTVMLRVHLNFPRGSQQE